LPPDLIIYGLIAAGLIFWLRSILGTRNGEERERQNPYLAPVDDGSNVVPFGEQRTSMNGENLIAQLAQTPKGNMSIECRTAELGLVEVARNDRGFDVCVFLQAAQDAFVFIVESFAEGDRETLKELLGPQVYDAFEGAIKSREDAGEVMKTEIRGIKKAEISGARIDNGKGMITVRFVAEETTFTKDSKGEIIYGHPDKTTMMRDVWTFARDLRSRDPRWLVVETREDGAGDNVTIPNTH
jgi:predicted lipid-binding transport protein (Tim44 family)